MSTRPFSPINQEHADALAALVGPRNVSTEAEKLAAYSRDEVPASAWDRPYTAEALVFAESTEDVSKILAYANAHRIAVTPRGAGTGLSGGAVPACGGIVLSLEKMNRILELDEENLTVTVEPGVVTSEITKLASAHKLLYAGDPCSGDASFIGGNVAENAGGNKVIKYGATGAQVLGLEAVLADGRIVRFGGKRRKDVTGYDFVHLLVGSEGTLAVVTEVTLKLLPMPEHNVDLLAAFSDLESAIAFVPKIVTQTRILPASIEYIDHQALSLAQRYLNCTLPAGDAGAHLIIQLEGNDPEILADEYERVGDLCLEHGAFEVFVADNRTAKDKLWKARKSIPEAISTFYSHYLKEDVVVPVSKIPALLEAVKDLCTRYPVTFVSFGHAGDGNIHLSLLSGEDTTDWKTPLHEAQEALYRIVESMGGTLSGEHGIGLKRRDLVGFFLDETQQELIRRVKTAFDPNGILNPFKIVPWTTSS